MELPPSPSPWVTSIMGTPASSRRVATSIICSIEIWCCLACIPSRSDMSWRMTLRPVRSMFALPLFRGRIEGTGDNLVGDHLTGAQGSGGHDVEVSSVGGQEVAKSGNLHPHGDAVALEHGSVFESVARDVALYLSDHVVDGLGDRFLVWLVFGEAVDGVTHQHRRFCRVDDDDRLSFLRAADLFYGRCGCARELIDVVSGTRSDGLGGNGGDDFGVFDRLDACDSVDHGDGRLAATGDHVDVHFACADVLDQVHGRNTEGADGCRGEVDTDHATLLKHGGLYAVNVGAGRVEDDLDVVFFEVRQEAVQTGLRDLQAELFGALESLGFGVNPDHPDGVDVLTSERFVEQVGPDVSGADDSGVNLFHSCTRRVS